MGIFEFFRPNSATESAQTANRKEGVEANIHNKIDRENERRTNSAKTQNQPVGSADSIQVLDNELSGPPPNAKEIADKYVHAGDGFAGDPEDIEVKPYKYPETEGISADRLDNGGVQLRKTSHAQRRANQAASNTWKNNNPEYEARREAMRTREDRKAELLEGESDQS